MSISLMLLPDFGLILFGYLLRRLDYFSGEFWLGLEKFIYFVLFPPLLFRALAAQPIDLAASGPMLLAGVGFTLAGLAAGYLVRPLSPLNQVSFASGIQSTFRFNSYIGFAVIGSIDGQQGIATIALLCGAMIPLVNVIAVSMLARHSESGIWRELASNPLILGILAGMSCQWAAAPPSEDTAAGNRSTSRCSPSARADGSRRGATIRPVAAQPLADRLLELRQIAARSAGGLVVVRMAGAGWGVAPGCVGHGHVAGCHLIVHSCRKNGRRRAAGRSAGHIDHAGRDADHPLVAELADLTGSCLHPAMKAPA